MSLMSKPSNMEPLKQQFFLLETAIAAPTNRFQVPSNKNVGSLLFQPPGVPLPGGRLPTNQPAPGVYVAAPYRGIVVVPKSWFDERCIVGPRAAQPRMPTVTPDLELIPQKPE
jgi:hypothetical protein